MLAGIEDTSGMRRPDLRISVGDTGRIVECKRLSLHSGHPHAYVYSGIERFVGGAYVSGGPYEYMVGFLQRDNVVDVVDAVNSEIIQHRLMGLGQGLTATDQVAGVFYKYTSRHVRMNAWRVTINHYVLDLCA
jgi:hypothetical protein